MEKKNNYKKIVSPPTAWMSSENLFFSFIFFTPFPPFSRLHHCCPSLSFVFFYTRKEKRKKLKAKLYSFVLFLSLFLVWNICFFRWREWWLIHTKRVHWSVGGDIRESQHVTGWFFLTSMEGALLVGPLTATGQFHTHCQLPVLSLWELSVVYPESITSYFRSNHVWRCQVSLGGMKRSGWTSRNLLAVTIFLFREMRNKTVLTLQFW